jgi:uncharacterized membrane protein
MAKTPASIASHPIHPMIIAVPLGLWVFSFACDIIYLFTHGAVWETVALYSKAGGIAGALVAAIPGFIDWLSLTPNTRTKRIGTWHMILNLLAVVLYAINVWWRNSLIEPNFGPIVLSAITILFLCVSGWLGGALVYEHGVGVVEK